MTDSPPQVIVCQGPPRCDLEGDDAVNAQIAGRPWCRRITVYPDGREEVKEPGEA